jgi:hypothetical protein
MGKRAEGDGGKDCAFDEASQVFPRLKCRHAHNVRPLDAILREQYASGVAIRIGQVVSTLTDDGDTPGTDSISDEIIADSSRGNDQGCR